MDPMDAQIACIAACRGAVIATRNERDFADCGVAGQPLAPRGVSRWSIRSALKRYPRFMIVVIRRSLSRCWVDRRAHDRRRLDRLAGAIRAARWRHGQLGLPPVVPDPENGDGAYLAFIAFYAVCCLITWAVFMRQRPGRLLGV